LNKKFGVPKNVTNSQAVETCAAADVGAVDILSNNDAQTQVVQVEVHHSFDEPSSRPANHAPVPPKNRKKKAQPVASARKAPPKKPKIDSSICYVCMKSEPLQTSWHHLLQSLLHSVHAITLDPFISTLAGSDFIQT
jgi:hypothetical protein